MLCIDGVRVLCRVYLLFTACRSACVALRAVCSTLLAQGYHGVATWHTHMTF